MRWLTRLLARCFGSKPAGRKPVVEELEPRILYSADANPLLWAGTDPSASAIVVPVSTTRDVQTLAAPTQQERRREIVFVDASIPNHDDLLADVLAQRGSEGVDVEVVQLRADADGIDQVSAALQGREGVYALHFITHGSSGAILLGDTRLDSAVLTAREGEISAWRESLAADADILLYGCDVGQGSVGAAFVGQLALTTDADVAASADATGHESLGGNWRLEASTGRIEAHVVIGVQQQVQWVALLPTFEQFTNATSELEIKSDANHGQTFLHTSGSGTYSVNQISMFLRRDADANTQNITVELRDSWNGAVLASASIASSGIGTTAGWVDFNFGAVTLNDSQTYVIRIGSSTTDGKVFTGFNGSGGYANGTRLDAAGSTLAGEDLAFRVAGTAAPAIDVSAVSGLVTTEGGGSGQFSVVLESAPSANVTVSVTSSDTTEATVSTSLLTFTSANWSTPQTVTVTGVNDTLADGLQPYTIVLGAASSADADYNGLAVADVQGATSDDDITYNQITVDTAADTADGDMSSLAALAANRGADGFISLREAMTAANNTANGVGGADRIHFAIAGAGPHTINVASALPTVSEAVVIDGSTEPDYISNVPVLRIDGAAAGAGVNGITIGATGGGSTIRGLTITRFSADGINIASGASNVTIAGNWIGTTGTGSTGVGNGDDGIDVAASNAVIGGTGSHDRNVITNSNDEGITIVGSGVTGHQIQGNYIGVDPDGSSGGGNFDVGIAIISGTGNTIGGTTVAARNVISMNWEGVEINTANNTIQGNYIGTDASGAVDRGNRIGVGVQIQGSATGNLVGGTTALAGNVISGNATAGIQITDENADGNTIQNNYVGINAAGTATLANGTDGIEINNGADNTTVGGVGSGNWIVATGGDGIQISGVSSGTVIQGNRIGTDAAGTTNWGSSYAGVLLEGGAFNNTVGGAAVGAGNLIAFSGQSGTNPAAISLWSDAGTGNALLGNSIYWSQGLGIDLVVASTNGVTANDAGDSDSGANHLQNFPVLLTAAAAGGNTVITGTLNSTANTTFRIEFFSSAAGSEDPSGHGEAQNYLGFATVTTNGAGNATINATLTGVSVAAGDRVTATATVDLGGGNYGSTSEFALNVIAIEPNTAPSGSNGTITVIEDTTYTFTPADFGFSDAEGHALLRVWFDTLPTSGTLLWNGSPFAAGNWVDASDIATGLLTYVPPANANGNALASFSFRVQDNGGTANGGIDTDPTANTITIDITAVNDAPSFSVGTGVVTTAVGAGDDYGVSSALLPDGKILVAGYAFNGTNNDFAVAKYNTDGSLDTSFGGGDGIVTASIGANDDLGRGIVLLADGKFIVAGNSIGANNDFAVMKFNADGTLDMTFGGGDGQVTTAIGTGDDAGRAVAVQADGKIVVVGLTKSGGYNNTALVRYHSDGTLDATFGAGGIVVANVSAGNDVGQAVTLQADGKILVAGESGSGGNDDFSLLRFNADGTLDASFGGGDGIVTTAAGTGNDQGYAVAVQSDGRILVAGRASTGTTFDMAVARYTASGTLDASFGGGDGIQTVPLSAGDDQVRSIAVQSDGKIVLAGSISNGSNDDLGLVRLNADGSPDAGFGGGDGITTIDFAGGADLARNVLIASDGRIVLSGYGVNGASNDFAVLRFNADGSRDTRFNLTNTLGGAVSFTEGGAAVVLDADVQVYDAELTAANNFSGATLTLARHGGANAQDVFSATGTLSSLAAASGNVVVGGTTIGAYTQSGGTLLLTFNASATNTLVNSAMQQIAYANSSDAPPVSVQVDWIFNDGNTGAQGTGAALTTAGSTTVTITAVNDAPTAADDSYSTNEDAPLVVGAPTTGLLDWFRFEEGNGQTATSAGSSGSTGTLGTTAGADMKDPVWTTGRVGGALDFNTDAVVVTDSTALKTASTFTLSIWFQADSWTSSEHLLWQGYPGGNGFGSSGSTSPSTSEMSLTVGGYLPEHNNKVIFHLGYDAVPNGAADAIWIASSTTFTDTVGWHHVAVTLTDIGGGVMEARLFVDGVLEGTDTGTMNDRSYWDTLRIGSDGALSREFGGRIDEVRIYDEALTATQVQAIAQGGVLANDSDAEGNPLQVNTGVVTGPANGSLQINADGSFTYTPNANFSGTDSFTYRASDGTVDSNIATVTISVNPVNDAPTATNLNAAETYVEDTPLNLTDIVVSDIDSANVTVTLTLSVPAAGGLNAGTSGSVTSTYDAGAGVWTASGALADVNALLAGLSFSSAANYNGSFSIATSVSDGVAAPLTGTKAVTGIALNDAPMLATNNPLTVPEESTRTITSAYLQSTDVDHTAAQLVYTVTQGPGGGSSLRLNGVTLGVGGSFTQDDIDNNRVTFRFSDDAFATSFRFTVSDGVVTLPEATFSINGQPVNDAPVNTVPASFTVAEDTPTLLGGISIADLDAGTGLVTTRLQVSAGVLNVTLSGATVIFAGSNGSADLTLRGTVADINASLASLSYAGAPNVSGVAAASLTVTTDDGGNSGTGGAQQDVDVAQIDITAVNDAPVPADRPLIFDGTDVVVVAPSATLQLTDTLTIEALIQRAGAITGTQLIVNKEGEYEIGISASGTLQYAFANGSPGWNWIDTGAVVPVDTWTHVAVTYDNGQVRAYIDGHLVHSATAAGTIGDAYAAMNDLTIGGRQNATDQRFVGLIDEVRVWNIARSAAEIDAAHAQSLVGNEAGLMGYWRFDEASGPTAADASGNGNDGTLGGAVDAPQRLPSYVLNEDGSLSVPAPGVLAYATDADGDPLTAVLVGGPSHAASFTLNADGSFVYVPLADYAGADSFTFAASDGSLVSKAVTVTLTVTPVADAPTIVSNGAGPTATLLVAESTAAVTTVVATDADLPAQTLTYAIVGGADAALFSIDANTGVLTFNAPPDYEAPTDAGGNNVYDVTVQVADGAGGFDTQAVSVTVTNVNEGPTAANPIADQTATEDVPFSFTFAAATFNDVDVGDTLTYSASGLPAWLTFDAATRTFSGTPTNADLGAFTVTVRATDAGGLWVEDQFGIVVASVNDAPVVTATVGLLSYNETAPPAPIDPALTVSDADSATLAGATVRISANYASGQDVLGFTDTANITGSWDAGAGALTLSGVASVAEYQAALRSVTYLNTSENPSIAVRTVEFVVDDGALASAAATRQVQVVSINDEPATADASAGGAEDAVAIAVTLNGSDVDGTVSQFRLSSLPANGTLYVDAGLTTLAATGVDYAASAQSLTLYFVPTADWNGVTVFQYTARDIDGAVDATPATATITIMPVNDAPVITSNGGGAMAAVGLAENTTAVTTVTSGDIDGGATLYAITGGADAALFSIDANTGVLTFNAPPDYEAPTDAGGNNVYDVTVQVADGNGGFDTQAISVTVTNVNEPPLITSSTAVSAAENQTSTITVTSSDVDGTAPVYSIIGGADAALFSIDANTGVLTFNAPPDYEAPTDAGGDNVYDVTVQVADGDGGFDTQAISVTITNINETPVVGGPAAQAGDEDTPLAINGMSVNDADGNLSTVQLSVGRGTLNVSLAGGAGIAAGANDSAWLTLTGTQAQVNAALATLTYLGATDFHGSDTLTVRATDALGTSSSETVAITVAAVNDAPVVTSGAAFSSAENTALVTTLASSDVDGGAPAWSIAGGADAAQFAVDSASGQVRFTALPDFESPADTDGDHVYQLVVSVDDGSGGVTQQLLSITVGNVNEAPSLSAPGAASIAEGSAAGALLFAASASDPDAGDAFSFSLPSDGGGRFTVDAANGQVRVAPGAVLDFETTPTHMLQLRVTDAQGLVTERTIAVTLSDVAESVALPDIAPAPAPDPAPIPEPAPVSVSVPVSVPVPEPGPVAAPTPSPASTPARDPGREPASERVAIPTLDEAQATPLLRNARDVSNVGRTEASPLPARDRSGGRDDGAAPVFAVSFLPPGQGLGDWSATLLDALLAQGPASADTPLRLNTLVWRGSAIDAGPLDDGAPASSDQPSRAFIAAVQDPVRVASATLTAGFVWWLTRSGGLLTSILMGIPAWRHVDLLPVLATRRDDDDESDTHDEQPPTQRDSLVDHLFSNTSRLFGDTRIRP